MLNGIKKWVSTIVSGYVEASEARVRSELNVVKQAAENGVVAAKQHAESVISQLREEASAVESALRADISHLQADIEFLHIAKRDAPGVRGSRPVKVPSQQS